MFHFNRPNPCQTAPAKIAPGQAPAFDKAFSLVYSSKCLKKIGLQFRTSGRADEARAVMAVRNAKEFFAISDPEFSRLELLKKHRREAYT
jgi:hypothetical protein